MSGASARGKGALEVILFSEKKFVGSLMFTGSEITIGRERGSMVRLDDPAVSARHAVLHFTGRSCLIEELGSRTGVYVNGQRTENHLVGPTDEITIGKFRLKIALHRPDEEAEEADAEAEEADAGDEPESSSDRTQVVAAPHMHPAAGDRWSAPQSDGSAALADLFEDEEESTDPDRHVSPAPPQVTKAPPPEKPAKERAAKPAGAAKRVTGERAPIAAPVERAPIAAPVVERAPIAAPVERAPIAAPVVERAPIAAPVVERAPIAEPVVPVAAAAPVREVLPSGGAAEQRAATENRRSATGATPQPAKKISSKKVPIVERAPERPAELTLPSEKSPAFDDGIDVDVDVDAPDSIAPAEPPHFDDDDEDDEFEPDFSLLELLRARAVGPGEARSPLPTLVEVIVVRGESVREIRHLPPGASMMWGGQSLRAGAPGSATLSFKSTAGLELYAGADPVALTDEQRGRGAVELLPGQSAIFAIARDRVCVQFAAVAAQPAEGRADLVPTRSAIATTASSFALHIGIFLAIGFASIARSTEAGDNNEGRYAKVAIKDLELEPPPPKPPEPVPVPVAPVPVADAPTARQPKVHVATTVHTHAPSHAVAAAGPPGGGTPAPSASASKALSALGALSMSPATSVAAATNLDAVGATRSGAGFKISGAIGKMPGDQLRMAGGGSGIGRVDTKSASELTRGGSVGKITGPGGGNGKVRALVTSPPARNVQVQGDLDRGEIQKVVNAHLREVQGCYERKLIKEPTLAGKLIFEWMILPTGSVGTVRIKFSDMRSMDVTTCIQSSIQSWTFPQPHGGSVTVTYPFVFSTLGT